MNIPGGDSLWFADIIPKTPPIQDKKEVNLSDQIAFALENREDLKQLRLSLEIQNISVNYSANQLLPSLALEGVVSVSGEDEEFRQSWGGESDSHNYSIGLVFEYPLGNRSAKSDYNTAVLEQKQARLTFEKKEQAVVTEVRQAIRAVDTAFKQIAATGLAEQLARQQLESETRKYEEGLSTNFQVLEYQKELASALSDSTRARVSYQNALDTLDKTIGATLSRNNIKID
jgi:outer membrane protein TolC